MDFFGLYGQLKGYSMPYDPTTENSNLIDLNNNQSTNYERNH